MRAEIVISFLNIIIAMGSNPDRDFGFFSCEEAIQLFYGTSVVLSRCPFAVRA
jgi:hypothetical protein